MKQILRTAAVWILSGLSAQAAASGPAFRLVSFDASDLPKLFTVVDVPVTSAGAPTLSAPDFQLLEDGNATAIATRTLKFRDTGMGLALIVAIDVSPSMEGRPLNAIREGLAQLVSRKREKDRVTVLTFAGDFRWETRWDASASATQEAFRNLRTRGNQTRLYDAVAQSMDEFAAQSRQDAAFPSRMSILLLSDGHDEGSRIGLDRIANRLRASRIRLDAVGLAHSPLWLRSLQALAVAGFGGFRTASTPEQLTQMLGDGIDALLDMPALQFAADNVPADGKSHQLGVEHLPTHWRDQMAVTVPRSWFSGNRMLWIAAGVAALFVIAGIVYAVRRREPAPKSAAAPSPIQPSAIQPSAPPAYRRTTTQVEPAPGPSRSVSPRVPTAVEPRPVFPTQQATSETVSQAAPARVGTMFAPSDSKPRVLTTLIAASGPYAGQRFPLNADEFWIGSSANNNLCLDADPAVSGNHACIRREDRIYRLYDNGSLNNTTVNGRPIGREVVPLKAGDRIRIGQSEFSLES